MPGETNKVLIVDDDEDLREIVEAVLTDAGFDVIHASNGNQALEIIKASPPTMILSDVKMPGMSGTELLKTVRRDFPNLAEMPFILISGEDSSASIQSGLDIGADDYITKPIDIDLLEYKVKAALRQSERISKKHLEEHVKLYRKLTETSTPEPAVEEPVAKEPAAEAPSAQDTATDATVERDAFEDCLVADGSENGSLGHLNFVDLEDIKNSLGDKWDTVSENIIKSAEAMISKALTPNEVLIRQGPTGFMIHFPDLDRDSAQLKVDAIVDNLRAGILGEGARQISGFSLSASAIAKKDLPRTDGKIDLDQSEQLFEADDALGNHNWISGSTSQPATDWLRSAISIGYKPVWHAKSEKVIGFGCRPCRTTDYGLFFDDRVLHGGPNDPLAPTLGLIKLENAVDALKSAIAGEPPPDFFVSLQIATLKTHQTELLDVLERGDSALNAAYLNIELTGILPKSIPYASILDAVSFMKPHCRRLYARIDAADEKAAVFRQAGCVGFSMALTNDDEASAGHVPLKTTAAAFTAAATGLEAQTMVSGVNGFQDLMAAIGARFTLIAGRSVSRALEKPRTPYSLPQKKMIK